MFRYMTFCALCVFGQFVSAQIVVCQVVMTQDCSTYYTEFEECDDTDCDIGLVTGLPYCPSGTTGCVVEGTYSGTRSANTGEHGFTDFSFNNPHPCQRCGDCNGCTPLGLKCKDDVANWEAGLIYYDLVGVGNNCTGQ